MIQNKFFYDSNLMLGSKFYCKYDPFAFRVEAFEEDYSVHEVGCKEVLPIRNKALLTIKGSFTLAKTKEAEKLYDNYENERPFDVELRAYDPINNVKYLAKVLGINIIFIIDRETNYLFEFTASNVVNWTALNPDPVYQITIRVPEIQANNYMNKSYFESKLNVQVLDIQKVDYYE